METLEGTDETLGGETDEEAVRLKDTVELKLEVVARVEAEVEDVSVETVLLGLLALEDRMLELAVTVVELELASWICVRLTEDAIDVIRPVEEVSVLVGIGALEETLPLL